jgi:hypothetical protein
MDGNNRPFSFGSQTLLSEARRCAQPVDGNYRPFAFGSQALLSEALRPARLSRYVMRPGDSNSEGLPSVYPCPEL